jgi:hypothetical protein
MKTYRGNRGTALLIRNLDGECVINSTPWSLYPRVSNPSAHLNMRLNRPQSRSTLSYFRGGERLCPCGNVASYKTTVHHQYYKLIWNTDGITDRRKRIVEAKCVPVTLCLHKSHTDYTAISPELLGCEPAD